MRGRRPKPTRIKFLTGNPGKRPLNAGEPRPDPGVPSATILKALGRPISAEIPYDANQVQAMRRGTPLVMAAPESPFTQAAIQLLRTV